MAITKIHAIKTTVQKSVEYICNPHKTDNRILIDTFACGIETAAGDFEMENKVNKLNSNPAYHLIQSFAPGEVTFEEAHQIGQEFASRLLGSTRPYVLATHVDREHVHNHIIFCSTDMATKERYSDSKASYRHIRALSDTLCREHNLSVITPGEQKGKSYKEWSEDRKNNSIKLILKRDIFDSIRMARDYEDFLRRMMEKGYQIKGEGFGEDAPKYISFKPAGYGNFIRGSHRTLGKGNTKEEIVERIRKQTESRAEWRAKQNVLPLENRKLISISPEKLNGNPGLENWLERENMRIAMATFASVGTYTDLMDEINNVKEKIKENRSLIVSVDKEKKILVEQLHYLKVYKENKPADDAYQNAKDPDEYLRRNESKLILFNGAKTMLDRYHLNPDEISVEDLQNRLAELERTKSNASDEVSQLKTQLKDLTDKQKTLEEFFHFKEKEQKEQEEKLQKQRSRRRKKGQEI